MDNTPNASEEIEEYNFNDTLIFDRPQVRDAGQSNYVCGWYDDLDRVSVLRDVFNVSSRCPADVCEILTEVYDNAGMKGMVTTNKVCNSIEIKPLLELRDIGENINDKTVVLTFKQEEKQELLAKISSTNPLNCFTIHEFQGRTSENIVLVRLSHLEMDEIYSSASHQLVALTRHTVKFTYYTRKMGDSLCKRIKLKVTANSNRYIVASNDLNVVIDSHDLNRSDCVLKRNDPKFEVINVDDVVDVKNEGVTRVVFHVEKQSHYSAYINILKLYAENAGIEVAVNLNTISIHNIYKYRSGTGKKFKPLKFGAYVSVIDDEYNEYSKIFLVQHTKPINSRWRRFILEVSKDLYSDFKYADISSKEHVFVLGNNYKTHYKTDNIKLLLSNLSCDTDIGVDQNIEIVKPVEPVLAVDFAYQPRSFDIGALQDFFNSIIPNWIDCDMSLESELINELDLDLPPVTFKYIQTVKNICNKKYDTMIPELKTSCPSKRDPTFNEMLLAVIKRNLGVHKISETMNDADLIRLMVRRFVASFVSVDKKDDFRRFFEHKIDLNESFVNCWLPSQDCKIDSMVDPELIVDKDELSRYSLMIKRMPKLGDAKIGEICSA
ncbi:hypothetical protein ACJJTC_006455 [Scirpophaga incertulas]